MLNTTESWEKFVWVPLIIGAIIGGLVVPILWYQKIIPEWSLFLGIIPLVIGGFITSVFRQMEYKPGESSTKCVRCGLGVYVSSMDEHLKVCEG